MGPPLPPNSKKCTKCRREPEVHSVQQPASLTPRYQCLFFADGCYTLEEETTTSLRFTKGFTLFWKRGSELWLGYKNDGQVKWFKDHRTWGTWEEFIKQKPGDTNLVLDSKIKGGFNIVDRRRRLINRFIRASLYCQTS